MTNFLLELKELVRFYGKDPKVDLAFEIYQAQLLKYIGEGIAVLGGLDSIVFSGSEVDPLAPVIHNLIKKISFLGINTQSLPWTGKKEIFPVTSAESKIKVYLNRMSLPDVLFSETVKFLQKTTTRPKSTK